MKDKCDDRIKADQKKLRRQDQGEIEMTESKGGRGMERFNTELEELKKKQKELESRYSGIGTIRFLMFLVMAGGLIVGLYDSNIPFLIAGILAVVAFVFLVFKHGKLNEQLEYNKAKVIVYERYLKRYDDSWKEFEEDCQKLADIGEIPVIIGGSDVWQIMRYLSLWVKIRSISLSA